MHKLRYFHRYATIIITVFALFLGVTGTLIQTTDLWSIYGSKPANDPNVRAMREAFDGPGGFVVRTSSDYEAASLPADLDYNASLAAVLGSLKMQPDSTDPLYVEFRMAGQTAVGQVGIEDRHIRFDLANGALLERTMLDKPEEQAPISWRNTFKHLHRMTTFGNWALGINIIVALGLLALIVTGVLIYVELFKLRRKIKKPALFYPAGGMWRSIHRAVSVLTAAFLLLVTLSGGWLAVESLGLAINASRLPPRPAGAPMVPRRPPGVSAVNITALPQMLAMTLKAARAATPNVPFQVVRLREYGGYPQGVVVTGGENSQQLVFDTRDGHSMSETEPGYPPVLFPFGWQAHQIAKNIHRGDYFGLTGRWMDFLAGLALIYLATSGAVMYLTMWLNRRVSGRRKLIWF